MLATVATIPAEEDVPGADPERGRRQTPPAPDTSGTGHLRHRLVAPAKERRDHVMSPQIGDAPISSAARTR